MLTLKAEVKVLPMVTQRFKLFQLSNCQAIFKLAL